MDDHSRYELNVGKWLKDHIGWQLSAAPGGFGYRARPAGGRWIEAPSLDELAAKVEQSGQTPQL